MSSHLSPYPSVPAPSGILPIFCQEVTVNRPWVIILLISQSPRKKRTVGTDYQARSQREAAKEFFDCWLFSLWPIKNTAISSTVLIASYFRKPNGKFNWFLRKIILALLETENSALQQAGHHTAVITCSSARHRKQFSTKLPRVPRARVVQESQESFRMSLRKFALWCRLQWIELFSTVLQYYIWPYISDTSCSW